MNGFHVHWDHNTDVCDVLANVFDFGNSTEDQKKAWAMLIRDLGSEARPYLSKLRKEFGVRKRAVDKLFLNSEKHKIRYGLRPPSIFFSTRGRVGVGILIQDCGNVQVNVRFNRNSASYATELAFKLGAHPVVRAHAVTELANQLLQGEEIVISHPESIRICKVCSAALWD